MMKKKNDPIRLGDMLYDYVPSLEDREQLIKTRDIFTQFMSQLGTNYSYAVDDYLEEIFVTFYLNSNYRSRHIVEFILACSLMDGVFFETKFSTPRLFGDETLAHELFMDLHTDEINIYKEYGENDEHIKWSIAMYPDEKEVTQQMISECYNRLLKTSTYIISKMERAYWEGYTAANLSPDTLRGEHISKCKFPYSYEVYEGLTNTGRRALFIEDDYGEVYIESHNSIHNKTYIAHFYSYPVGPEEFEDAKETYEIERDEDRFFILDTTKDNEPHTRVVGEGGRVHDTDFIYFRLREYDDRYSTYIIVKNPDKTIQVFEMMEEDSEINEVAKIEELGQMKPYKDAEETQMNANYKISTRFNSGEKIAFIYAIAFLSL